MKYLEQFASVAEQIYGSLDYPLMTVGRSSIDSDGIRVSTAIQGSETGNEGPTLIIQRAMRIQAFDTTQKFTSGGGTNLTNRLNSARKIEWKTLSTQPANKRDLLIEFSKQSFADMLKTPGKFQQVLASRIKNRLAEGEEKALANVWQAATINVGTVPNLDIDGTIAKDELVLYQLDVQTDIVELFVDKFVAYSDFVVAYVHPTVFKAISRVRGKLYNPGAQYFSPSPNVVEYGGIVYIKHRLMNTISGGSGKAAGAIVMTKTSYWNAGLETNMKDLSQRFMDINYIGHSYAELDLIIDPKRMRAMSVTLPTGLTISAKVNDPYETTEFNAITLENIEQELIKKGKIDKSVVSTDAKNAQPQPFYGTVNDVWCLLTFTTWTPTSGQIAIVCELSKQGLTTRSVTGNITNFPTSLKTSKQTN